MLVGVVSGLKVVLKRGSLSNLLVGKLNRLSSTSEREVAACGLLCSVVFKLILPTGVFMLLFGSY